MHILQKALASLKRKEEEKGGREGGEPRGHCKNISKI